MRTEFKIGIIVGLAVVAGGIIFFVNQGKKTAGNVTDVLPMDAPAGKAAPTAAKPGTPGKPGQPAPPRITPTDKTVTATPRPPVTTPLTRSPTVPAGPSAQPAAARPMTQAPPAGATPRSGETAPGPTPNPAVARPTPAVTPTPASPPPTTQPRPTPELPPLAMPTGPSATPPAASPTEPTPTPAGPSTESVLSGAPGTTPGVAVPPRKEPEPVTLMPPPAPERSTPVAAGAKYTVVEGDSLWSIAAEQYGDGHLWTKLKAANPGIEDNVKVGQVLSLPSKEDLLVPPKSTRSTAKPEAAPAGAKPGAKPATETAEAKPGGQVATYTVESGDTLFKIAAKVLGNGHRWRELLELNKEKLARPEDLKAGMELRVPAKEGQAEKATKPETKKPALKKVEPKKSEPGKNGGNKKN